MKLNPMAHGARIRTHDIRLMGGRFSPLLLPIQDESKLPSLLAIPRCLAGGGFIECSACAASLKVLIVSVFVAPRISSGLQSGLQWFNFQFNS